MDPHLESEVGGMNENFNMLDFLLSNDEDQLMFLTLLNPCHGDKTAFGKRLWADQLLRFLKIVASASITAALVTLECRIPDIDGRLEENTADDNDEDEDEGENRENPAEEEQEEKSETTEGENACPEEIDVAALQSLSHLLDEWEDAKLRYYLNKRNISSNNLTGISPIKLEAEEAREEEKRLPTKNKQDEIEDAKTNSPGKPSRFLDDIKKLDKTPHKEKIPASVYSDKDSSHVKSTTESTKPVHNPELWYDPKPYSKPLDINSASKTSPQNSVFRNNTNSGYPPSPPISLQNIDSRNNTNSGYPPSPPIYLQNNVSRNHTNLDCPPLIYTNPSHTDIRSSYSSALPPSPLASLLSKISGTSTNSVFSPPKSAYPSSNDIRTSYGSALPPSPPIRPTPSKPSSKAPVTTPVPPGPGKLIWVPGHTRKAHHVKAHYKKDGTFVKGYYRKESTVKGHYKMLK